MAKLLAIAAKSPDVDVFADSMVAALGSTTLLEAASLDEIKLLLKQVQPLFASSLMALGCIPGMSLTYWSKTVAC